MSVTVATRSAGHVLGSTVTVGEPTGATINQRLRGGLFGFADQTTHVGPTVAVDAAAHAGTTVSVRRIDGMLNYTPIKVGAVDGTHPTLGQSGEYSYDFTILDEYIAVNADEATDELFISLDYCPQILGGNLAPAGPETVPFALAGGYYKGPGAGVPNDHVALGTISADIVDRAVTRCAAEGIDLTYVGLWNEPDGAFFDGEFADWLAMYEEVAPAIKAIHPALKVGGPELAHVDDNTMVDWIEDWLAYCKANAIPVDFISWHSYESTGWNMRGDVRRIETAIADAEWEDPLDYVVGEFAGATLLNWPGFGPPPFGTATTEKLTINDHSAAMLALQMIDAQDMGIERLIFFASQSMSVTLLSGLFNADGPTAAGNVFRLWQRMGDADVLEVTLDADPGIHALAAQGDDSTIYVLLVSHHYRRDGRYRVTIELDDADGREPTMTVIDRAHSNQFDAGVENAELQTVPIASTVEDGQVQVTLQARAVCLLEIAP